MQKAWKIIGCSFTWIFVSLAVFVMIFTLISIKVFDQTDREIFGYKLFIVTSDSMKKTDFDAGALIFVKEVAPETLEVGDIISFKSVDPKKRGAIITHKIRNVTTLSNGELVFTTYGTTTDETDEYLVSWENICGKYCGNIPNVGYFLQKFKTVKGYFLFILIPFLAIITIQLVNTIKLYRKYRQEQHEELRLSFIEQERLESKRMQDKIRELQAQLAEKNASMDVETKE